MIRKIITPIFQDILIQGKKFMKKVSLHLRLQMKVSLDQKLQEKVSQLQDLEKMKVRQLKILLKFIPS